MWGVTLPAATVAGIQHHASTQLLTATEYSCPSPGTTFYVLHKNRLWKVSRCRTVERTVRLLLPSGESTHGSRHVIVEGLVGSKNPLFQAKRHWIQIGRSDVNACKAAASNKSDELKKWPSRISLAALPFCSARWSFSSILQPLWTHLNHWFCSCLSVSSCFVLIIKTFKVTLCFSQHQITLN